MQRLLPVGISPYITADSRERPLSRRWSGRQRLSLGASAMPVRVGSSDGLGVIRRAFASPPISPSIEVEVISVPN